MRIEDHARLGIVLLGANTLQCAVGDLAAADAVFGTADQFGNCRDRLIQRTRSDQSYQVRNLDGVIVAMGVWFGMPNAVKSAGAASVSHIASIAASFIFWCSLAA